MCDVFNTALRDVPICSLEKTKGVLDVPQVKRALSQADIAEALDDAYSAVDHEQVCIFACSGWICSVVSDFVLGPSIELLQLQSNKQCDTGPLLRP
ncbi:hypothetical protein Tco_0680101 [Tanacetum coccineum]|uniref:Uncharacterized protein n=1 Tax=Tanacetum coccineum TaxID=301880 RepID=A0ABQ4XJQ4_9ASTR